MDILFSAVVGDLFSRSASFVINKYFQQQPGISMVLQSLERVVLRIDTVVEEAEGRHITNQGMLRQLYLLKQGMYRGHYILDALRFRAIGNEEEENKEKNGGLSHSSSALSTFIPAKRLRFSRTGKGICNREAQLFGTNNNIQEELQRMVNTLEDTMDGMKEFLFFLKLYPRIVRQPYGAYLLLDNCMFGRQTERQRILNFLLCSSNTPDLAVLPIVGPIRVGKSTLVEYVCRDDSVRSRFSMIIFFPEGSLMDGVIDLKGNNINGLVKHQNCASQNRLLVIVEIAGDINEEAWRSLKSSVACMAPYGGSKIIITSRSDRIVCLGTTQALRLDYLTQEAYWYFFKSLVFGSTNPEEEPKLATMAMEIASEQRQCFTIARIIAGILRDNFSSRVWRTILECMRAYKQTHFLMSDKDPILCLQEDEPVYYWRLGRSRNFLVCNHRQLDSNEEVPKISVQDIILGCGGSLPHGKFDALAWRSHMPPYYNYTITCEVQAPKPMVDRKKRVSRDEGRFI
ncbi:unnamed protein product [Alopecurus aequalis]